MGLRAFSSNTCLRTIGAAFLVALLVVTLIRLSDEDTQGQLLSWRPTIVSTSPFASQDPDFNCDEFDAAAFLSLASSHAMAEKVTYFRRHLRKVKKLASPPPTAELENSLLAMLGATVVDRSNGNISLPLSCAPALELPITSSQSVGEADLSQFLFGVSTSIDRLYKSASHFRRFLTRPVSESDDSRVSNKAGLVVLLHNSTEQQNHQAEDMLRQAGITAKVQSADVDHTMAERYFSLVPTLYAYAQEDKSSARKWLVLIDDDTFFPHPQQLSHAFRDYSNATDVRYFLGGLSEFPLGERLKGFNNTQLQGGAGIFLSLPMAAELLSPLGTGTTLNTNLDATIWHKCLEEDTSLTQGDTRIASCIYRHTDVQPTRLEGLHQEDLFGDPSGFYESGTRMLSIHHWKSWHWMQPDKFSMVGDVCGEDCVLQRWVFPSNEGGKGYSDYILPPIILTNGFSLVQYPQGIWFNWSEAENTFDKYLGTEVGEGGMDYGLGKLRPKLEPNMQKRTWFFLDAVRDSVGGVRQWYGWRNGKNEVENLAELVWLP